MQIAKGFDLLVAEQKKTNELLERQIQLLEELKAAQPSQATQSITGLS